MKVKPQLPYSAKTSVHDIVSAFESIKPSLHKLDGSNMNVARKITGLSLISANCIGVKDKDREITFSYNDRFSFEIKERKGNEESDIFIKNDFVETSSGIEKTPTAIELFIKKVCEALDFPILQLRKFLAGHKLETYMLPGQLSTPQTELTNEIGTLFHKIETTLKSIENASTRAYIKKSYPSIKTDVQMLKRYDFSGIGKNEEDYSIQILNDRKSKTNIVIRITDKENNTQNIIIEPDGKVLKSKNITSRCNLGGESVYYSQAEIDSPTFRDHLITLKNELEKYHTYILDRIEKCEKFKHTNTTESIGIIEERNLKIIQEIRKKYDILRAAMHKLKETEKKELAKEKLGISTTPGNSTILFKGDENIRLGFPPLKGKESVKILVLDKNRNITKSFCIQDNHLIKFNPVSISRGKRNDTENHYHTQQEIDTSGLSEYLTLLDTRLNKILKIISQGHQWYKH